MSKKVTENTEEKQEKVLTKYDLKMQRREEEKRKAKREERIGMISGIVIVAALVCLVASFPIRTYLTVNGTYIKVAGEKVTRVEFDYNYNLVKNNYIAMNGYYMSMFGIDLSGDLSKQMYSETLTWQDYFEQLAVNNIINNKALRAQAEAAGFTYDTAEEYDEFREALKKAASDAGMSEKAYIQQLYGPYATASRLEKTIQADIVTGAYYEAVSEEKTPSNEDILTYYEENRDTYDSVDYYLVTVNAELPTEPTDLADPVEDTDQAEDEAGEGEGETESAYEPSEAEIEFAMQEAYKKAEEALKTIVEDGELKENVKRSGAASLIRDWLFDSGRKDGDTTIVENETSHSYYAVRFIKRYRDDTPSVDARVILLQDQDGQAVLNEWKSGAATEESFAELADKYNDASVFTAEGGLVEGMLPGAAEDALTAWLYDSARKSGDTEVITPEDDGQTYVVYYVGPNDPSWILNIRSMLLSQRMADYTKEISQGFEVEDPKGNLNYLKVQAAQSSAEAENGSDAEGEDGSNAEDGSDAGNSAEGEDGSNAEDGSDAGNSAEGEDESGAESSAAE